VAQAKALMKTSATRLAQGTKLRAVPAATDPHARRSQLVERMRTVFGQSFVVLPQFSCNTTAAAELKTALAASKTDPRRRCIGREHLVRAPCPGAGCRGSGGHCRRQLKTDHCVATEN
jgi:hypothetical protein